MNKFTSVQDVEAIPPLIKKGMAFKSDPLSHQVMGKGKVLGLVFFNASLRTRLSTIRAAYNLGMQVITLNVNADSWKLEFDDGTVMDQDKAEHIKDAIPVIASYCDVIGVRSFPSLQDREKDYEEQVLHAFLEYSNKPIINLESATLHPLQSLADLMTIEETKKHPHPKVVLSWAPHVKPLPQSVANSFLEWSQAAALNVTLTHPPGFELSDAFTQRCQVVYDQDAALEDADFVYVKNWSSYTDYGKIGQAPEWMMTLKKLEHTNEARLMHCLPVRRNVVISDDAIDSGHSIIQQQAENRLYAAQSVLHKLLNDPS